MKPTLLPDDVVFWQLKEPTLPPLSGSLTVDIVVVGGGMAGLTAAQSFCEQGLSVALLEKTYCGAGATGKSSGFVTPNSELSLSDLVRFYGTDSARLLWEFVSGGVEHINNTIHNYKLACDYTVQDTLVVATNHRAVTKMLEPEHKAWQRLSYNSILYSQKELPHHIGTTAYYGGLRYGNTFGINGYRYCQELKKVLVNQGVNIYEETPVTELTASGASTPFGTVKAGKVIVCMDRFIPDLGKLTYDIYHAQTFLMLSSPLSDTEIQSLFPDRPYMVWDTNMIYNYYRLTAQGRLMVGGAQLLSTYAHTAKHNNYRVAQQLKSYIKRTFPQVSLELHYLWPGMLGITKDLMPIAGFDKRLPHVYYIGGATGLPWAAALGKYSALRILKTQTRLDELFSYKRFSKVSRLASMLFGKPLTFALGNFTRVGSL